MAIRWRIVGFVVVALLAVPLFASAQASATDIQAQIQSLLATIANLEQQIRSLLSNQTQGSGGGGGGGWTGPGPSWTTPIGVCPALSRFLQHGARDTFGNDEVARLQLFLKDEGYYTGAVNGIFDSATEAAVQQFQADNDIAMWGSPPTTGFGAVGPRTRAAISQWCVGFPLQRKFSAFPQSGVAPLTVQFSVNVQTRAAGFSVDFGDGGTTPVPCTATTTGACVRPVTLSHTYPQPGSFTARLKRTTATSTVRTVAELGIQVLATSTSATNTPPVISFFSGPTALKRGASGTWAVTARDADRDALSYFMSWGDSSAVEEKRSIDLLGQTISFMHSYSATGTYAILATVRDGRGGEARATSTVSVSDTAACAREYRPVCGEREVVCVTAPCNPVRQTYGNRCLMDTAGARFVKEGVCGAPVTVPPPAPTPSPSTAPAVCKLWFDGCNVCSLQANGTRPCTQRVCTTNAAPYCLDNIQVFTPAILDSIRDLVSSLGGSGSQTPSPSPTPPGSATASNRICIYGTSTYKEGESCLWENCQGMSMTQDRREIPNTSNKRIIVCRAGVWAIESCNYINLEKFLVQKKGEKFSPPKTLTALCGGTSSSATGAGGGGSGGQADDDDED